MPGTSRHLVRERWFLATWLTLWTAGTLADIFTMSQALWRGRASEHYRETRGTLLDSSVGESSDEDGTLYHLEVRYAYEVDGRHLEGTRIRWGASMASGASGRERAERALEVVRAEHPLRIYFDPAYPAHAVLRRGVREIDYFCFNFLYPFVLVMLGGWGCLWRRYLLECRTLRAASLRSYDFVAPGRFLLQVQPLDIVTLPPVPPRSCLPPG